MTQFDLKWIDLGRKPQVSPDPRYPNGKDVHVPRKQGESHVMCSTEIPYPPPHENVGQWEITCRTCGFKLILTAASRPDDARSVTFPCMVGKEKETLQ